MPGRWFELRAVWEEGTGWRLAGKEDMGLGLRRLIAALDAQADYRENEWRETEQVRDASR